MNHFRILFIVFSCFLINKTSAQNISVNPNETPENLVQNILINSSCINIENVNASGNPRPNEQSYASFTSGTSGFPFSSGLILSTSPSKNAEGPYKESTSSGVQIQNWNGDDDLNKALGITTSTQATVLEFDFTSLTNSISFNYIFASNEYQSYYPCNFSDGFAFLIKEVGSSEEYRNLAVLPNSSIAVSSTTVHPKIKSVKIDGKTYDGCNPANESYFNGYNSSSSPINYAGQTTVMNAQTNVIPNKKYHLKLVVADDETRQYNSAVFLEGGSFITKINFGKDRTLANNNAICFGESYNLDTQLNSTNDTFKWYKKDSSNNYILIPGASAASYTVTSSGSYKVEATLNATTCVSIGEVKIEFTPEIFYTDTSLFQCDDNADGFSAFDLTKVNNIVKNNNSQIINQGYYETLANAQAKTNPIANPSSYTNKTANQIVFARIENSFGCYATPQVALNISASVIPAQSPAKTCDRDEIQDGLYQFTLSSEVTPQLLMGLPTGLVPNYYLTSADAVLETNVLPDIFKNTIPYSQTIYARVANGSDCYGITPIELVVNTFDPPNFGDETKYLCKGDQITLEVATGFTSYLWSTDSNSNSIEVTAAGDYSVSVTDENDCQKTKKFKVILSEPALITGADVKDFSGIDNSVLIQYSGVGNYEFSLNGIDYQDDPLFTHVSPGVYNVRAVDKNGCGGSNIFKVYVLDYPRFFTPNNDGQNDLWTIKNIDQMPNYTISIFDRYGKLLKQLNPNSLGWNGFFNGQQMPSDDYWFTLFFVDGKNVKGHFSLKR